MYVMLRIAEEIGNMYLEDGKLSWVYNNYYYIFYRREK